MNGFFNIFKSSGVNSTFIVNKIKRLTGTPCGHMGTLDPMASGVLPVAVGKSTRLFDYLADKVKTYEAEFTFGYETDTLDATGTILKRDNSVVTEEQIREALGEFIGEIDQVPPKYSANNINGKRGYELARKGIEFELKSKRVTVYKFELKEKIADNIFTFTIECGKGTYIRSLCRDLAKKLGTLGTMSKLCRTKSGIFTADTAISVEELQENPEKYLIAPDTTVSYEKFYLTEEQARKILNGVYEIKLLQEGKLYRVYSPTEFYGIGKVENGLLKIKSYCR